MQASLRRCCFLALLWITACGSPQPAPVASFAQTIDDRRDTEVMDPAFAHCPTTPPAQRRAMWLWYSPRLAEAPTRADVFAFAHRHRVNTIYLEGRRLVGPNPDGLAEIVEDAADQCIRIELLFGRSSWALAANHEEPLTWARDCVAFADSLPGARPTAIHFDIEPYTLDEWAADPAGTIDQFLDLYDQLQEIMSASDMELVADIPFWFDGRLVDRDGEYQRPLSELIAERTDRIAIMDYRDTADRIIESGRTELDFAQSIGREVVIGVETIPIEPEEVTFENEGTTVMWAEVRAVVAAFSDTPAFHGIAFHHYITWRYLEAKTILRESRVRYGLAFFEAALSPARRSE